jgi:phosphoribosyl 1,2-cyclic phosphodiesterase
VEEDFKILGSSSSGNSAFLDTGNSKILIDAGFSGKQINEKLKAIGESVDSLDAVFLTHEHSDHSQGIRGISKRYDLPIFANRDTADAVQTKLKKNINWKIFETGTDFTFRDLKIRSYSLPHDAYDPVGFNFYWGEPDDLFSKLGSLAWVTDLGYIPEHVKIQIKEVQTLVIESNFEERLLKEDTKRPLSIKQRIRGRHGHLSNEDTFQFLNESIAGSKIESLHIAHLSKDCNKVELVLENTRKLKEKYPHLEIQVVDPNLEFTLTSGKI